MLVRAAADRTDQVVRLVARQFAARQPHRVQHFLHHRQLRCQLIRHALARGLIRIKLQVAEGLFLYIKADHRAVGLFVVLQLKQRGKEAIHRIGGQPLVVGELPHAVKRAVEYTVAVYHHDFHECSPHHSTNFSYYLLYPIAKGISRQNKGQTLPPASKPSVRSANESSA